MSTRPSLDKYTTTSLAISAWAEADRPREKLLLKGRQQLSDAELLAILLGSGSRRESAVALARRILTSVEHDLHALGKLTGSDLQSFRGIGEAKAVTVLAALELGRRRQLRPAEERPQIRQSSDAYRCFAPRLSDLDHEECWMLCLNRANYVLQCVPISSGGRAGTVVDAKIIFGKALEFKASSIILAHNHPSTNLQPSTADRDLTHKLFQAGRQLDLPLLDHLIVSERGYYSFKDEGDLSK